MEKNKLQNVTVQSGITPPQYIFIGLLIIAAFFIGSLYTKVQYLEKNGSGNSGANQETGNKPKSKYSSFDEAMKQLSKNAKIDGNKLVACMNSGQKKDVVEKSLSYGSSVGVQGTPAFFINGRFIGGAFPASSFKEIIDKELAGTGSDNITDYSDYLQNAAKQGAFNPVAKNVDLALAQIKGSDNAKVTIVEFSDFQCPYCKQGFDTIEEVLKLYEGKIKFGYVNYPLIQIHPRAEITAEAAECAADQGKFWDFHNQLFESQNDWSVL
jgi:protein-disulfide isomerase